MLVDSYLRILHIDRRMPLNFDLGPLHIHLYARSVFFMWVTVVILVIGGIAVLASRRRELIQKWTTWVLIAPVVGIPIWIGRGTTAVLAAALAVVAVMEYARLVKPSRVDTGLLLGLAVLYPLAAWLRPSLLALAPIVVLACALPLGVQR
jgi:phosphatidate cytidylyltransferase